MKQPDNNQRFKAWLGYAGEDILVARLAMEQGIYNQVCFHAQQVAEKALKAILKAKKGMTPKIHNLVKLFHECVIVSPDINILKEACSYLDRFYAPTRYPDAFPGSLPERLPNEEEAKLALKYGLEIYDFVVKLLE